MNPAFSYNHTDRCAVRIIVCLLAASGISLAGAQPVNLDIAASRIDVAVHATGDSFVGHLDKYQARVVLEPGTLTPREAEVTWDFADLSTGKEKRDRAMLEWLEHDRLPRGRFTMEKWEVREGGTWAVGQVAYHGVTNSLSMPVRVTREDDGIRIRGEVELDYRRHRLMIIRMLLVMTVDPRIKVTFDLHGRLAAAAR